MTGRRLYEIYTSAAAGEYAYGTTDTVLDSNLRPSRAWAFLGRRDKAIWNVMARRITPKPRRAKNGTTAS